MTRSTGLTWTIGMVLCTFGFNVFAQEPLDSVAPPQPASLENQKEILKPEAENFGSAPENIQAAQETTLSNEGQATVPVEQGNGNINPNTIGPVIFSFWEHEAIKEAVKARGLMRPHNSTDTSVSPGEREIALSGIVYESGEDWTIWLNGFRITPQAIPKEILDLKVHKDYIDLKWFDSDTNQIFPLRLRPHQRFNIDSRIFLPGK